MQRAAALEEDDASFDPIKIEYTVREERGERYVTEKQFREGMAVAPLRAQAMTINSMRRNQNTRNYVNI